MKQVIGVVLSCITLTFLMGWWAWNTYHIQQNRLGAEASLAFTNAMQKEKALQIKSQSGKYDSKNSSNEIPSSEKDEWCDQDFLFYRDSTRTLLDSLFVVTLLERNIQTKTAVRCMWENRIIDTCPDSSFYLYAHPLEVFIYRINEDPNRNIMLQGYVKLSSGTVWGHSYLMWLISGLWFLLSVGTIGGYCFWYRKLRQQQQQLQEPSQYVQNKTVKWVRLSNDLLFDEEHGDLSYRDEVSLRLTENSLKLFRSFIKVEQQKLTYEKICKDVLVRSIKDGLSKTDRDAVTNAIRHLRIHLKPIPVIQIEPMRGTGYQMIFLGAGDCPV